MIKLSNKWYNILKWVVMIALPACATLYFSFATIWGFPYGEQVVVTIAAVTTFLGALIGISTKNYNQSGDGEVLFGGENDALMVEEHELVEPDDANMNEDIYE